MPPRLRIPLRPSRKAIQPRRNYIAAPKPGSGPLLERRSDRALPPLQTSLLSSKWIRTLPLFAVIMTGSCLAIFNYQKQSSSVVNSTLYALRTNSKAREVLGDEVYFASKIPWIAGEMNQLHGRIDISFWVKGTKGMGKMRFVSVRRTRMGLFETTDWDLEMEDGRKISLLDADGPDPFKQEEI
ncbi:hypothetical protein CKM354_000662100 [Cercospora kikuchii]|uniref:Cytochrome oxidase complex assembly protein n=1 Tax=Cercospora kikuchii TaxID=84275 RepID=A0A9P3CS39_9PEZI|nr:uncharacterized protein CKM354_000662100 [Cercospora kikuchii]GIZ43393.1 hypothetical protein CKM354_000662100 [Cercospora kikuchii]